MCEPQEALKIIISGFQLSSPIAAHVKGPQTPCHNVCTASFISNNG